jgi:hypothetical protein
VGCKKLHSALVIELPKNTQLNYLTLSKSKKSTCRDYRFGFNGQEKVNEIAGAGNHNTALFWEYDTRLGRRWNLDPVVKDYESGYACLGNSPIWALDYNGADSFIFNTTKIRDVQTQDLDGYHNETVNVTENKSLIRIKAPGEHTFFNSTNNVTVTNGEITYQNESMTQFFPIDPNGKFSKATTTTWAWGLLEAEDQGMVSLAKLAPRSLLNELAKEDYRYNTAIGHQKFQPVFNATQFLFESVYGLESIGLASGYSLKLLKSKGGHVNGFSISKGAGYGAKPRFDFHPLTHPSKRSNKLIINDWFIKNEVPIPHIHRGRGNKLREHFPWEVPK